MNKDAAIRIRLSAAEKKRLEAEAKADRRTLSDWIRLKLLDSLAKK